MVSNNTNLNLKTLKKNSIISTNFVKNYRVVTSAYVASVSLGHTAKNSMLVYSHLAQTMEFVSIYLKDIMENLTNASVLTVSYKTVKRGVVFR